MRRVPYAAGLLLAVLLGTEPAAAQARPNYMPPVIIRPPPPPRVNPPVPNVRAKISPAQAAAIAQRKIPGAKVVGVKLLSSGAYAVTLKSDNSVSRVMVSASDGSVM